MSVSAYGQDLVVLVPGKDDHEALKGMLSRPESLGIRRITYQIQQHPDHDPGCLLHAHEFLKRESQRFSRALVVFDRLGCGAEERTPSELERTVLDHLEANGWNERAGVVVIDPELESWVWSSSPHVERILGWSGRDPDLRSWLTQQGFVEPGAVKSNSPKEAFRRALREVRKPASSSLIRRLAETVSLTRCQDTAFLKLRRILTSWFQATR